MSCWKQVLPSSFLWIYSESLTFYIFLEPISTIWLKDVLIPKLLNFSLASCCLKNLDYLLTHTAYFDKKHWFFFFCLCNSQIFIFRFLFMLQTIRQHCFIIKVFGELLKSLDFWLLLSYNHIFLTRYLLKQIHHV